MDVRKQRIEPFMSKHILQLQNIFLSTEGFIRYYTRPDDMWCGVVRCWYEQWCTWPKLIFKYPSSTPVPYKWENINQWSQTLRDRAKFMGTYAGQKEFFRLEKSLCPFIFSREKSPCPVFFFVKKSVCPVIFPVKKSFCPFIWIESKAPFKSYKKGIMTLRNDE